MNKLTISKQVPASITFDKDKTIAEVRANLTAYYDDKGVFVPLDEDKLAESKKERAISSIKMFATSHDLDSDKYLEMFKSQPLDMVQQRIIEDSLLVKQIKGETVIETNVMDTTAPITTITRNLTGSIQQLKMVKEYCDKINVKWEE